MFCDGCGTTVQTGHRFCSKCGKQILGGVPFEQSIRGRVQQHSDLLAILWLAASAVGAIGGLIVLLLGLRQTEPPEIPISFIAAVLDAIGAAVLLKSIIGLCGGWGLRQREPWARVLLLVLGFIALINIPFGTALGVYTLWVLLPVRSQREYDTLVAAREAHAAE